ncbi:MAG TPA: siderophore ABC transporter substrate-binding protein [Psychrobacter pasteurii]|nr:siderophore ABC transporter substrate-binding protein [Psychrobacter pasteurii]
MMNTFSANRSVNPLPSKAKTALLTLMVSSVLMGCSPQESDSQVNSTETQAQSSFDETTNQSQADNTEQVAIDTTRGKVSLPANPNPLAVYDMTLMQDLAALEVPVAGLPDNLHLDSLKAAGAPESQNIGTLFEPDIEALNQMQPKAILIGSRMAEKYDALSKMAPTLDLTLDTENIYESSKQRLADLGKLFNKADKAAQLQQDIDQAIEQAKAASAGKGSGLVVLVNGNKISAYGEKSRFGFLHTVFGIPAADTQIEDGRHGQPVSFEYLQKIDPDWLFVLDRSSAIGEEGVGADAVLDNPLMHQTKAWKNKHIVYLSPDAYLAFGGYYQWLKDAKTVTDALSKAETVESTQ